MCVLLSNGILLYRCAYITVRNTALCRIHAAGPLFLRLNLVFVAYGDGGCVIGVCVAAV